MITLDKASLSFGSTVALDKCDLSISKGEQIALIGSSGSGKSSLLKVLATEYTLTDGRYVSHDQGVAELNKKQIQRLRSSTAYIPQNLALVPNLRVNQNVALGSVGKSDFFGTLADLVLPNRKKLERIHGILEQVGIPEKLFHRTDSLSGGQQQRVAIARALYQHADLILADEPVSAVDPTRAYSLLECFTDLSEQHGITLICSLHNLEYAKKFFPRMIGMRQGQIVFDGAPEDFSEEEFNQLYQLSHA